MSTTTSNRSTPATAGSNPPKARPAANPAQTGPRGRNLDELRQVHHRRGHLLALTAMGHKVRASKLTGTAPLREVLHMNDAGATRYNDFTALGWPSTYLLNEEELLEIFDTLDLRYANNPANWWVVELATNRRPRRPGPRDPTNPLTSGTRGPGPANTMIRRRTHHPPGKAPGPIGQPTSLWG